MMLKLTEEKKFEFGLFLRMILFVALAVIMYGGISTAYKDGCRKGRHTVYEFNVKIGVMYKDDAGKYRLEPMFVGAGTGVELSYFD